MHWLIVLSSLLNASAAEATERPTVIVVVGAEGSPEYAADFNKAADRWADAARRGSARVVQIGRDAAPTTAPTTAPATSRSGDKERLKAVLDAELATPGEPLWVVLIGHGTFDGREAKFNLRGPDVSDQELAEWLRDCRRPLAVVNCASASAPFLNRLSGEKRVVITATQSGHENNLARFGEHMSAAVADPAADLDKDGQTSLLEAYLAASHRVEEFYKQGGRLATEHALLDDNGDRLGTPAGWFNGVRATRAAKDGAPLDGQRAHQWHLVLTPSERAMPPDLRARRDELEVELENLRRRKATTPEAEYYAQLEALLIELARLYEQQDAEGKSTP
jgi:hypothetical protein